MGLHEVIYEAETPAGRAFNVALIGLVLLSVLAVMLESVGARKGTTPTPSTANTARASCRARRRVSFG